MAVMYRDAGAGPWTEPLWDIGDGVLAHPPARYDPAADELVARFLDWSPTLVVTVPLAEPVDSYIGVIVEEATGRIVGIQIDALAAAGVKNYPHWAALLHPLPPRETVAALVVEVRELFNRYGAPPE